MSPLKTTRQQILDLLATRGIATATEISQSIHITHANARHHLNNLKMEGLVKVTGYRSEKTQRGRPSRQYQLSSYLLEHNLVSLTNALLKMVKTSIPKTVWTDFIDSLAKEMVEPDIDSSPIRSLSQKLNEVVKFLNPNHYHARWEAHTEAPRLILEHCPYKQLIFDHPELCEMDAKLIENFLTLPVELVKKLEPTQQNLAVCIFAVKK